MTSTRSGLHYQVSYGTFTATYPTLDEAIAATGRRRLFGSVTEQWTDERYDRHVNFLGYLDPDDGFIPVDERDAECVVCGEPIAVGELCAGCAPIHGVDFTGVGRAQ
jgi:hypothetical protein